MDGQNLKDVASDVRFFGDYFQLWIKSTVWCANDGGRVTCVVWIELKCSGWTNMDSSVRRMSHSSKVLDWKCTHTHTRMNVNVLVSVSLTTHEDCSLENEVLVSYWDVLKKD